MNRGFNKLFLASLLVFFSGNVASAIQAEFKNALIKVDLTKVSESSYNVNLYTQNKFSEPVKIIKKSDLNYYILLPETKNNQTKISSNGAEIRNISTNLYPYAGQDVNNGYTKININTTRPINFSVNVKNVASAAKIVTNTHDKIASTTDNSKKTIEKESKVQKKNLQNISSDELKKQVKSNKVKEIKEPKIPAKKSLVEKKLPEVSKKNEAEQKPLEEQKSIEVVNEESIDELETQAPSQEVLEPEEEITSSANVTEKEIEEIEKIAQLKDYKKILKSYLLKIQDGKYNIIFAILITLLTFIIVLKALSKKSDTVRLKSRIDLENIPKQDNEEQEIQNSEVKKVKNDGQYFVFEKNVRQTGFCNPATTTSGRSYELSTYEPDLKNKYNRAQIINNNVGKTSKKNSEYDIIQKILKEDSFIDISADEYNEVTNTLVESTTSFINYDVDEIQEQNSQTQIMEDVVQFEQAKIEEKEPDVLSSVEIAPERGFMCVSYNDNINLMGYIFDNVYPLYNFKVPKLESYDIKFRLSEKDELGVRFIVKVGGKKMLVRVAKNSMKMEVLM